MPVDGEIVDLDLPPDIGKVLALLGDAELFQTVRTREGMMLVDDNGLRKGLPQNPRASDLYAGGYIAGPAVLFTQAEWDVYDAAFSEPGL
jgi:hypothetical protein